MARGWSTKYLDDKVDSNQQIVNKPDPDPPQSEWNTYVRKVDVRLPGKEKSNSHGARPIHQIAKDTTQPAFGWRWLAVMCFMVQGSGLGRSRVRKLGFRVEGDLGFRVRVQISGCMVQSWGIGGYHTIWLALAHDHVLQGWGCRSHCWEIRVSLRVNSIYRGTSLVRNTPPVGPYSSPMPRHLWWS